MTHMLESVRRPAWRQPNLARVLGGGATLVVLDQGLVSAGNFALTACIARLLTLSDFGSYMLVMTLVWLFTDIQIATVTGPYTINRAKLSARKQAVFFGSAALHQGVLIVGAMLFTGVAFCLQSGADARSASFAAVAAALAVAGLLARDQMRRFFVVHQQLADCLKFDGMVLTLHGSAIMTGITSGQFSLVWAFASVALSCALSCLWWVRWLGFLHNRFSLAIRHWRMNWSIGRWMVLSGVLWSFATYLYPWTITVARGAAETGLWAAALGLSSLCNVPLSGLFNHYAVRIAGASHHDLKREVVAAATRLAALAGCFVVLFVIAGNQLMGLLYGPRFVVAAPLTIVMTLNLLLGGVSFCVSRGLFAVGRGGADSAVNIVPLLLFALVGVWATISFGAMGAAISFLISNAAALMLRAVIFSRVVGSWRAK